MIGQYIDGRGYTRNYVIPREGRPVTITEDETIELNVQALSRDFEHNGLVVQITQNIHKDFIDVDNTHHPHQSVSLDSYRVDA
jgi:hypothetical protein